MNTKDLALVAVIGVVAVLILWQGEKFLRGTESSIEKLSGAAVKLPGGLITSTAKATGEGFNTLVGDISMTLGFPNMAAGEKDPLVEAWRFVTPWAETPEEEAKPTFLVWTWHKLFG